MITIMQDAINELYRCFDVINSEKCEGKLPQPIITIQKTPKALGHCSIHKNWANKDNEEIQEDNDFYEINIASNYLNNEVNEILHTLIHECVHLFDNSILNKNDCTGKKHTKRFYKTATEIFGLTIDDNDSRVGYGYTKLNEDTVKFIEEVIKPDPEKFKYFYHIPEKKKEDKDPPKKFNKTIWCPSCQLEIKLEEGFDSYSDFWEDLNCPECGGQFEIKSKSKRGRKAKED